MWMHREKAAVCHRKYQPSKWPSKNWPAADCPAPALRHTGVETQHASVLMLPVLPPHPRRVHGPPMMILASAGWWHHANAVTDTPSCRAADVGHDVTVCLWRRRHNGVGGSLYSPVWQQWLLRELPWRLGANDCELVCSPHSGTSMQQHFMTASHTECSYITTATS